MSSGAFCTADIPKSRSEENPVGSITGSSVKAGSVFMAIDETAEQDERPVSQTATDNIQREDYLWRDKNSAEARHELGLG